MTVTPRIPAAPNKSIFSMNRWFQKMHQAGLLFHPDDAAETIVDNQTGKPTFTPEECLSLNATVALMFEMHGDRVYSVGLNYFHKAMGIQPDYSPAF